MRVAQTRVADAGDLLLFFFLGDLLALDFLVHRPSAAGVTAAAPGCGRSIDFGTTILPCSWYSIGGFSVVAQGRPAGRRSSRSLPQGARRRRRRRGPRRGRDTMPRAARAIIVPRIPKCIPFLSRSAADRTAPRKSAAVSSPQIPAIPWRTPIAAGPPGQRLGGLAGLPSVRAPARDRTPGRGSAARRRR